MIVAYACDCMYMCVNFGDEIFFRKVVMAAPRSGGSNIGTRGHDACYLSFPI